MSRILIISLTLSFLLSLYCIFSITKCNLENKKTSTRCSNNEEFEQLYKTLSHIEHYQMLTEGTTVPLNILEILQTNEREDYCFVLFFSRLHCNICIESHMKSIGQFIGELAKDNVICLVDYQDENSLHIFKRMYQIHAPVYKVDSINLPFNDLNMPYCFIVNNKSNKVESCFIPLKEDAERTDAYLQIVKEKYFKEYNKNEL